MSRGSYVDLSSCYHESREADPSNFTFHTSKTFSISVCHLLQVHTSPCPSAVLWSWWVTGKRRMCFLLILWLEKKMRFCTKWLGRGACCVVVFWQPPTEGPTSSFRITHTEDSPQYRLSALQTKRIHQQLYRFYNQESPNQKAPKYNKSQLLRM